MNKILIITFILITGLSHSQLMLNELTNNNDTLIYDEDGESPDYIELFYSGIDSVKLSDYFISDKFSDLQKYRLPSVYLQNGEHFLVFADGKNRSGTINHYETAIYETDSWYYLIPSFEPSAAWTNPGFNPAGWLTGAGGFGYADGDDNTTIPATNSIYFFKSFTLSDTSKIVNAILHIDYDDGFTAYLNGTEIARNNIGVIGVRPGYNDNSSNTHEATMYTGGNPEEYIIAPEVLKNIILPGTNVLAIQVHNQSFSSSDLSARAWLSFGIATATTFYGAVPSFFTLQPASVSHANFKISNSGETIFLTDGNTIVDSATCPALNYNHAYARTTSGNSQWCVTISPTPDDYNSGGICYDGYIGEPIFDLAAGYYPNTQTLTLSLPFGTTGTIYYSEDGDDPDASEILYTGPINIPTNRVIRARVFPTVTSELPSKIITRTYLINVNLDLPVFSIATDSVNLWDSYYGIYVLGYGADSANYPFFGANFWQNWERPMHVEYFHRDKQLKYNLDGGLKIHGGWSRALDQKSFRLLAKSKYDENAMNFPMITDKPYISDYHAINLRNGGNDYSDARSRDGFMQRLAATTHVDYMGYEPSYAFLNGTFFGHYEIRERQDGNYIENNHHIDNNNVDVISHTYWGLDAVDGDTDDFLALHTEITSYATPSDNTFYTLIDSKIDLFNFTDYIAVETYLGNGDWASYPNNSKFWHQKFPYGKWRWALWDVDFGLGYVGTATDDYLVPYLGSGQYSSNILAQMLNNPKYRQFFINRNADLINTIFQPDPFQTHRYRTKDSLITAIQLQDMVWGNNGVPGLNNTYINMNNFNNLRRGYQRNNIQTVFGLTGQVDVTLQVSPPGSGYIKISTITPELPWTGVYFNGNPVTVSAYANPGYTFDHWNANALIPLTTTAALTNLNITTDETFVAVFTGSQDTAAIVISELNYNSDIGFNSGNWIELWNPSGSNIELTGFTLQNGTPYQKMQFPDGTKLNANDRLIIAEDTALFLNMYPDFDISKMISAPFLTLKNSGDSVILRDQFNYTVFNFYYSDSLPWIRAADETGRTMELIETEAADFTLPRSWITSCMYGTPGTAHVACNEPLVISEINYNPSSTSGEWFELYNASSATINISGYKIKDHKENNIFVIPNGTAIEPGNYFVIASDTLLFSNIHTPVKNVTGNFTYNLSDNNEVIRVYSPNDSIVYSVWYDDENGWPSEADGNGKTLEAYGFTDDVNNGINWFAGCPLGSPGWPYKAECYWGEEFKCLEDAVFYFNPLTRILEVQMPFLDCDGLFFTIIDAKGALVSNPVALHYDSQINLSYLSSGIYFVKISNPVTGQILKQKFPFIVTGQ